MLNEKKYILNHILYEINNYIYSYEKNEYLLLIKDESVFWQNEYNLNWVCHRVSLRNLLDFFDWKKQSWFDEIVSAKSDLTNTNTNIRYQYFNFAQEDVVYLGELKKGKISQFLNKSIFHLTEERFLKNDDEGVDNYLSTESAKIYNTLKVLICNFLQSLLVTKNVVYNNQLTKCERVIDNEIEHYKQFIEQLLYKIK